jgi:hypothetical protein
MSALSDNFSINLEFVSKALSEVKKPSILQSYQYKYAAFATALTNFAKCDPSSEQENEDALRAKYLERFEEVSKALEQFRVVVSGISDSKESIATQVRKVIWSLGACPLEDEASIKGCSDLATALSYEYFLPTNLFAGFIEQINLWPSSLDDQKVRLQTTCLAIVKSLEFIPPQRELSGAYPPLTNRLFSGFKFNLKRVKSEPTVLEFHTKVSEWDARFHGYIAELSNSTGGFTSEVGGLLEKNYIALKKQWALLLMDQLFSREDLRAPEDMENLLLMILEPLHSAGAGSSESSALEKQSEGGGGGSTRVDFSSLKLLAADRYLEDALLAKIRRLIFEQQYLIHSSTLEIFQCFIEKLKAKGFLFSNGFHQNICESLLETVPSSGIIYPVRVPSLQVAKLLGMIIQSSPCFDPSVLVLQLKEKNPGPDSIQALTFLSEEYREVLRRNYAEKVLTDSDREFQTDYEAECALVLLETFNKKAGRAFDKCPIPYSQSEFSAKVLPLHARLYSVTKQVGDIYMLVQSYDQYVRACADIKHWLEELISRQLVRCQARDLLKYLRFLEKWTSFPWVSYSTHAAVINHEIRRSSLGQYISAGSEEAAAAVVKSLNDFGLSQLKVGDFKDLPIYLFRYHEELHRVYGVRPFGPQYAGLYNFYNFFIAVIRDGLGDPERRAQIVRNFEKLLAYLKDLSTPASGFISLPDHMTASLSEVLISYAGLIFGAQEGAFPSPLIIPSLIPEASAESSDDSTSEDESAGADESKGGGEVQPDASGLSLETSPVGLTMNVVASLNEVKQRVLEHWLDFIFLQSPDVQLKSMADIPLVLSGIPVNFRHRAIEKLLSHPQLTEQHVRQVLSNTPTPQVLLDTRRPSMAGDLSSVDLLILKAGLSELRLKLIESLLDRLKLFYADERDFFEHGFLKLWRKLQYDRVALFKKADGEKGKETAKAASTAALNIEALSITLLNLCVNQGNIDEFLEKTEGMRESLGLTLKLFLNKKLKPAEVIYPLALGYLAKTAEKDVELGDLHHFLTMIEFVIRDLNNNAAQLIAIYGAKECANYPHLCHLLSHIAFETLSLSLKARAYSGVLYEAYCKDRILVGLKESDPRYLELETWFYKSFEGDEHAQASFLASPLGKDFKTRKQTFHIVLGAVLHILFVGADIPVFLHPQRVAEYKREAFDSLVLPKKKHCPSTQRGFAAAVGEISAETLLNERNCLSVKVFLALFPQVRFDALTSERKLILGESLMASYPLPQGRQALSVLDYSEIVALRLLINHSLELKDAERENSVLRVFQALEKLSLAELSSLRVRFFKLFSEIPSSSLNHYNSRQLKESLCRRVSFGWFFNSLAQHIHWDYSTLIETKTFSDKPVTERAKACAKVWKILCEELIGERPSSWQESLINLVILSRFLKNLPPLDSPIFEWLPPLVSLSQQALPEKLEPQGMLDYFEYEALSIQKSKDVSGQGEIALGLESVMRLANGDLRNSFYTTLVSLGMAQHKYFGLLLFAMICPEVVNYCRHYINETLIAAQRTELSTGSLIFEVDSGRGDSLTKRPSAEFDGEAPKTASFDGAIVGDSFLGEESPLLPAAAAPVSGVLNHLKYFMQNDPALGALCVLARIFNVQQQESVEEDNGMGVGFLSGAGVSSDLAASRGVPPSWDNLYDQFLQAHSDVAILPSAFSSYKHQATGKFKAIKAIQDKMGHKKFNFLKAELAKKRSIYDQWMFLVSHIEKEKNPGESEVLSGSRGIVLWNVIFGQAHASPAFEGVGAAAGAGAASSAGGSHRGPLSLEERSKLAQSILSLGAYLAFVSEDHFSRTEVAAPEVEFARSSHVLRRPVADRNPTINGSSLGNSQGDNTIGDDLL